MGKVDTTGSYVSQLLVPVNVVQRETLLVLRNLMI